MKTVTIRILKIIAGLAAVVLLIHTILLVVSGIALRNARRELVRDGRPMSFEELLPEPVPASENGAPLYSAAFSLLKSKTSDAKIIPSRVDVENRTLGTQVIHTILAYQKEDSAENTKALEQLLADPLVQQYLSLIEQAAERPYCNFELQYDETGLLLVPHVSDLLDVSKILRAKSLLEARRGDTDQAWKAFRTGLKTTEALRNEPLLISMLVQNAMLKGQLHTLYQIYDLAPPSEESERFAEDFLTQAFDASKFAWIVDSERLQMEKLFDNHPTTINRHKSYPTLRKWIEQFLAWYRPAIQFDHALYLRTLNKVAKEAAQPYWSISPEERFEFDKDFAWYNVMARIVSPIWDGIQVSVTETSAQTVIARTWLALKQHKAKHGVYPNTLEEIDPQYLPESLPDPFTGQPLKYRREDDGFVVYSLGENLLDDHGVEKNADNRVSKAYDIVWRTDK